MSPGPIWDFFSVLALVVVSTLVLYFPPTADSPAPAPAPAPALASRPCYPPPSRPPALQTEHVPSWHLLPLSDAHVSSLGGQVLSETSESSSAALHFPCCLGQEILPAPSSEHTHFSFPWAHLCLLALPAGPGPVTPLLRALPGSHCVRESHEAPPPRLLVTLVRPGGALVCPSLWHLFFWTSTWLTCSHSSFGSLFKCHLLYKAYPGNCSKR